MGQVTSRTSQTSRGLLGLSPWNDINGTYSVGMINLGNNPLSKIEVVSALNSFNLAYDLYVYYENISFEKYNPKVYLGAVQSAAPGWNYDDNSGLKSELQDQQKSGSWTLLFTVCLLCINVVSY